MFSLVSVISENRLRISKPGTWIPKPPKFLLNDTRLSEKALVETIYPIARR